MDPRSNFVIEWGVAERVLPGQAESGDRHVVKHFPSGALVAVVDGLGHGEEAALAAKLAVNTVERSAPGSLISLLRCCHERLQGTRGAVMSMSFFDIADCTMTWLGVGNVEGIFLHQDGHNVPGRESLLLRGGVLGDHLPQISASIIPVIYGDLVIFATDGIRNGLADHLNMNGNPQQIADCILERHWRGTDDALVLVARFIYGREPKKLV